MSDRIDRIDRLFERRPGQQAVALALGRFVIALVVGVVLVGIADLVVGVPATVYLFVVLAAAVLGYLGYRRGQRLDG